MNIHLFRHTWTYQHECCTTNTQWNPYFSSSNIQHSSLQIIHSPLSLLTSGSGEILYARHILKHWLGCDWIQVDIFGILSLALYHPSCMWLQNNQTDWRAWWMTKVYVASSSESTLCDNQLPQNRPSLQWPQNQARAQKHTSVKKFKFIHMLRSSYTNRKQTYLIDNS